MSATDFPKIRSTDWAKNYTPYDDFYTIRKIGPVWFSPWNDCYVASYRGVLQAFKSPHCSSVRGLSYEAKSDDVKKFFGDWLLHLDPPKNTQLRMRLLQLFTPSKISSLRPMISRVAQEVVDTAENDQIEIVSRIAYPLPVFILAELIGIPPDDRQKVADWSAFLRDALDDRVETSEKLFHKTGEVRQYFLDLIESPTWLDAAPLELKSLLNEHPREVTAANLAFLMFAGQETTVHLISNMLFHLSGLPKLWASLRKKPSLACQAVDETLRLESPVQKISRITTQPIDIDGCQVGKDQNVVLLIGAANRDPNMFSNPDTFSLNRRLNQHLAFGTGSHLCVGRSLALLEAEIMLQTLLRKWRQISRVESNQSWHTNSSFRGLDKLMLKITPAH